MSSKVTKGFIPKHNSYKENLKITQPLHNPRSSKHYDRSEYDNSGRTKPITYLTSV